MEFSKEQKTINLQYIKDEKERIEKMVECLGKVMISPRGKEFHIVFDTLAIWNGRLQGLINKK